ncbi:M16 family metallopeptidase [Gloeobacter kilaueensis]|uniref:Peptidase M16 domain protein n=1 Tax=Gloeobacter kilaueensis (strain ATCC BAA-2537 / CCAP 1431/1 / ULC 316 / JS1) TaxID=1183438 RepID=U5QKP0_GLOK1|nr:pitrilysin family protein [Gloeobacter kilaueensis]AGY59486.1 peptidase M16 domain protein [Gloeobacter kilaueensis JS1]
MFRTVLGNGLRVLVLANPAVDIVSARFFIRSGSRHETQPGLVHLIASVLSKGTQRRDSMAIAHAVESLGAMLGADGSPDYFQLSIKSLGEDFPALLALAAELLNEATFPAEQIEIERKVTLQAIRSQQERPFTVAYNQFRRALYGEHPYAFAELGTEESVQAIERQQLLAFYRTHFRPDNAIFVCVGPVEPEAVVEQLEAVLAGWKAPAVPLPTPPASAVLIPAQQTVQTVQPTQQSMVLVGYPAVAVGEADFAALKLIGTYLGNGLSSRLFTELREKRGLAYEVSAFFPTRVDRSHFVTYIGTAPENTRTCEQSLRFEAKRLTQIDLSEEELQIAKNKFLGQYALGKQTNSQVSQLWGWYEAIGVGADFDRTYTEAIARLRPEDLRAAAERTFTEPLVSLVGPAEVPALI